MVTRKIRRTDKEFLTHLGQRIRHIILKERGFSSLDAFALEYHDLITKPTLYQICDGKRDMKITTLLGLGRALDMSINDLLGNQ